MGELVDLAAFRAHRNRQRPPLGPDRGKIAEFAKRAAEAWRQQLGDNSAKGTLRIEHNFAGNVQVVAPGFTVIDGSKPDDASQPPPRLF